MNENFTFVTQRGLHLLVYSPWWKAGLLHGMTTRQSSAAGVTIEQEARRLQEALEVDYLAIPAQCHGADVVDLGDRERIDEALLKYGDFLRRDSADAIVAPSKQVTPGFTLAYGVTTADCVPIIVRGEARFVLIHAGWRGLANGVIRSALSSIPKLIEAVVFASAGPERYEVGPEVPEAIGASCVYHPSTHRPGAYMLDTAATAIRQLRDLYPAMPVFGAGVCTISDLRFHSFRRDGSAAGRAVTFVAPPRAQPVW